MSNLTTNKLRMLGRGRNIDGYQNMSREQLEDLFIATPVPTSISRLRATQDLGPHQDLDPHPC